MNHKDKRRIYGSIVAVIACIMLVTFWYYKEEAKPTIPSEFEPFAQIVREPADGYANMSLAELQCYYRLIPLLQANYEYDKSHAAIWKGMMLDEKENMYARLCAAYFILPDDSEAQEFIAEQVASDNLRHRYNAAEVLRLHIAHNKNNQWGVDILIDLLSNGSLDGSGVRSSPPGDYPDGDRDDIMATPIERICWEFSLKKEEKIVSALISVLERRPHTDSAAFALGEIGDKRAIPILMKLLKSTPSVYSDNVVTALGKLKHREAVPILISHLGHPRSTFSGLDVMETEYLLEALLEIGDERAIEPIEEYLEGNYPKESKAVARRVLVQLKSSDPVEALLALLDEEAYEPERSEIISSLVKYDDDRVVKVLASIARTSDSAYMRREAIYGLNHIGNQQSLQVLASLLDTTFSKELKAEWGWKINPDFREYFPEKIVSCLKQHTKQDFGRNRAAWDEWIRKNVEPEDTNDKQ